MKVEVYDSGGNNVEKDFQPGDLVCTRPFPCMPVMFWGTNGAEKYRQSYFDLFPGTLITLVSRLNSDILGVWHHGDYMQVTKNGGILMLGRSDAILNPSGVRFGSSEIYNVLADSYFASRIADALCIGLQRSGEIDERVVLFLKLIPGTEFAPSLVGEIKATIRRQLSARHVPWGIFECPDILYTVLDSTLILVSLTFAGEWKKDRSGGQERNQWSTCQAVQHHCQPRVFWLLPALEPVPSIECSILHISNNLNYNFFWSALFLFFHMSLTISHYFHRSGSFHSLTCIDPFCPQCSV